MKETGGHENRGEEPVLEEPPTILLSNLVIAEITELVIPTPETGLLGGNNLVKMFKVP